MPALPDRRRMRHAGRPSCSGLDHAFGRLSVVVETTPRPKASAEDLGTDMTDMNVPRPANGKADRTAPSARDAMLQVLAEFDLDGTHCLLVPADPSVTGTAGDEGRHRDHHAEAPRSDARPAGTRPICGFELDGRRYVLYARSGPGRAGDGEHEDPLGSLTAREQQIVRLVCLGMVNKQIADRLRISEYTVKTYLKQIFCKLNVHSRSAMVYRCAAWSTVHALRDA